MIINIENGLDENYNSNVAGNGIGLKLTKERIELFNKKYREKGGIETKRINTKFITTIHIAFVKATPELT